MGDLNFDAFINNPLTKAVIFLIVALIVAWIVKAIVVKILKSAKLDEKLTAKFNLSDVSLGNWVDVIGKLVFAIVFLLFLPGTLDALGLTNVSQPIVSMINSFLNYIPNIVAALIILWFGFFLAKLLMQLVSALLRKVDVDKLQSKYGLKDVTETISDVCGKVVYAIVALLAIVASLDVLNISAISTPAVNMIQSIFSSVPNILVAIILIVIGVYLANIVEKVLNAVLDTTGLDQALSKIIPPNTNFKLSGIISTTVKVIIIVVFLVEAVNSLNFAVLSTIGTTVLDYLPIAITALAIIVIAMLLANWAQALIDKDPKNNKFLGQLAKFAIYVVAGFMALSHLGIASYIVNAAFIIILAACGVAFAVAFGVGGRDTASRLLNDTYDKAIGNKENK